MHEAITGPQQVTPEWLTWRLHERGHLMGSKVISVQAANRSQPAPTWFADLTLLEVGYSGKAPESAPRRLFLKVSRPGLRPADLLYGRKEVAFYSIIATAMDDPPLARCFDAVYAPDTGRSHVLLEDLSETHFQPPPPLPPSGRDCELVMDCLAGFHAHWWEHLCLGTDTGRLSNGETASEGNLRLPHSLDETGEMFRTFVDFLGDRLTVARCRLYERVLSSWPFSSLSGRLNERQAITLIHGDAHAWNTLYPRDPERGRVCIID